MLDLGERVIRVLYRRITKFIYIYHHNTYCTHPRISLSFSLSVAIIRGPRDNTRVGGRIYAAAGRRRWSNDHFDCEPITEEYRQKIERFVKDDGVSA